MQCAHLFWLQRAAFDSFVCSEYLTYNCCYFKYLSIFLLKVVSLMGHRRLIYIFYLLKNNPFNKIKTRVFLNTGCTNYVNNRVYIVVLSSEPPSYIAFNTSSSSIVVTWNPIQPPNGQSDLNITGYKVSYREHDSDQMVNNVLCSLNYTTELTNLKVFTNYCIELASFTNYSVSNRSQCLFTTTDEEGKPI